MCSEVHCVLFAMCGYVYNFPFNRRFFGFAFYAFKIDVLGIPIQDAVRKECIVPFSGSCYIFYSGSIQCILVHLTHVACVSEGFMSFIIAISELQTKEFVWTVFHINGNTTDSQAPGVLLLQLVTRNINEALVSWFCSLPIFLLFRFNDGKMWCWCVSFPILSFFWETENQLSSESNGPSHCQLPIVSIFAIKFCLS